MKPAPMISRIGMLVLRFVLGGVLLVAGVGKIPDPGAFAASINNFAILPAWLVPAAALMLPFLEIALGTMLVTGWRLRCAAFSSVVLFGMYTAALGLALARHLPLECDCFGTPESAAWALLRDGVLLGGAVVLYGGCLFKNVADDRR
jgi:uncharacterized membrane protein YphA (DoxX/SURF4 family)